MFRLLCTCASMDIRVRRDAGMRDSCCVLHLHPDSLTHGTSCMHCGRSLDHSFRIGLRARCRPVGFPTGHGTPLKHVRWRGWAVGGRVSKRPISTDYTMIMCLRWEWGEGDWWSVLQIRLHGKVGSIPLSFWCPVTKLTLMRDTNRVKGGCRALILLRQSHEATIGSRGFGVCSTERRNCSRYR